MYTCICIIIYFQNCCIKMLLDFSLIYDINWSIRYHLHTTEDDSHIYLICNVSKSVLTCNRCYAGEFYGWYSLNASDPYIQMAFMARWHLDTSVLYIKICKDVLCIQGVFIYRWPWCTSIIVIEVSFTYMCTDCTGGLQVRFDCILYFVVACKKKIFKFSMFFFFWFAVMIQKNGNHDTDTRIWIGTHLFYTSV